MKQGILVSSDRQKVAAAATIPGPPSSGDLLELVRSAEEEARLAIRKRTPAVPMSPVRIPSQRPVAGTEEEFVDVGDEAIDAPPSLPPLGVPTPASAFAPSTGRSSKTRLAARPGSVAAREPEVRRTLPPGLAIVIVLALAVAALALIVR
ncbi:MAG: hypothetical protein K0S65_5470 [Labilithrix sp.]|nr:hypothetical protein [Labilithrix sp.]